MCGNISLESRKCEVTLPPEVKVKFFDYDRLIIYFFFFANFLWLAGNWMLFTQRFFNLSSFDEGFPCDNLELVRLSYVGIFQDSRPQWSVLRYVG